DLLVVDANGAFFIERHGGSLHGLREHARRRLHGGRCDAGCQDGPSVGIDHRRPPGWYCLLPCARHDVQECRRERDDAPGKERIYVPSATHTERSVMTSKITDAVA